MLRIVNPVPFFFDGQGDPLDNGKIWIGLPNEVPEANQIQVYWDPAGTIPADQPLVTLAGLVRNGATPAYFYVNADDYSMTVADSNNATISYAPSYLVDNQGYQPLDSDLTAIAALTTTPYGRSLLTMANLAALQAALGGLAFLPLSGGTMAGDIGRQGGGKYTFYDDSAYGSGRIYVRNVGDANPGSNAGDITFFLAT